MVLIDALKRGSVFCVIGWILSVLLLAACGEQPESRAPATDEPRELEARVVYYAIPG